MNDWPWARWGSSGGNPLGTNTPRTFKYVDESTTPDWAPAAELIREQVWVQRELVVHEWQKTDLLEQGVHLLENSGFCFGLTSFAQLLVYPTAIGRWVEYAWDLERAVREVDDRIKLLKTRLKLLSRRIQTILGIFRIPSFLRAVVIIQSRFYIFHGNHPPRLPGFAPLAA